MLSWLSGTRAEMADGDNQDQTVLDIPETPAHLFAVRAFKQAFFGTPQPVTPFVPKIKGASFQHKSSTSEKKEEIQRVPPPIQTNAYLRAGKSKQRDENIPSAPSSSPTKPPGILMTPGTATSRRKQVKFGEKVVDNEGKSTKYSLSGLPDDYPGKFPSPWTPKITPVDKKTESLTKSSIESSSDAVPAEKQLETRVKQAVDLNATQKSRSNVLSKTARVKDDGDITTDVSSPSSASGRYWKEQYETYSTRSEAELNRLIVKHRVAKDYAKMKDEELTALKSRLELDRRKRQEREEALGKQVKDLRERLRVTMAENAKMSAELSLLRASHDPNHIGLEQQSDDAVLSTKIRSELIDAGFQDVEIPFSKQKLQENGLRSSGIRNGSSKIIGTESSGQDIWLDHEDDDTYQRRRRIVKSVLLPAATPISKRNMSDQQPPLSSKFIREKLNNPLASRSANIIGRQPPSNTDDSKWNDMINFGDGSGPSELQSITPSTHKRGKSPRSAEAKLSNSTISAKRKDSAKARIAERRRNKHESRHGLKQAV